MRTPFIVMLSLLAIVPVRGEEPEYAHFGDTRLQELVQIALEKNPGIRRSFSDYQAALQRIPQVSSLPDPMIGPERVAQAILDAATRWTRDKKVGAMATLNTLTAKLMPGIADKLSVRKVEAQQQGSSPQRDPEGALYHASEDGRIRGARIPA